MYKYVRAVPLPHREVLESEACVQHVVGGTKEGAAEEMGVEGDRAMIFS